MTPQITIQGHGRMWNEGLDDYESCWDTDTYDNVPDAIDHIEHTHAPINVYFGGIMVVERCYDKRAAITAVKKIMGVDE